MTAIRNFLGTYITPYSKALVPVLVLALLGLLEKVGVTGDLTVEEAVTLLVTGGLVWLVPNRTVK